MIQMDNVLFIKFCIEVGFCLECVAIVTKKEKIELKQKSNSFSVFPPQ